MEKETDKIHVISLADDWEVESQSGVPLAHEDEKCDAINTARKLATQRGVETVILHHGDGVTEKIPATATEETSARATGRTGLLLWAPGGSAGLRIS